MNPTIQADRLGEVTETPNGGLRIEVDYYSIPRRLLQKLIGRVAYGDGEYLFDNMQVETRRTPETSYGFDGERVDHYSTETVFGFIYSEVAIQGKS